MKVSIIAIGSAGDVYPFIALGKGLKDNGYDVTIATHLNYKDFITQKGIKYFPVHMDFKAFMKTEKFKQFIDPKGNPLKTINGIKPLIEELEPHIISILRDSIEACKNSDVIISVSTAPGYHIAEKFNIPCFLAAPYPFQPTKEFITPLVPFNFDIKLLNKYTHYLTENMIWIFFKKIVNTWRQELELTSINYNYFKYLRDKEAITLYGFSPQIVSKPKDWSKNDHVTGYWFLDKEWTPPKDLVEFIDEGAPPVYIGFGSGDDGNSEKTTEIIIEALEKSNQRGVIYSGWTSLGENISDNQNIYRITDYVPHSWLFPKMASIIHHGGAGTTGTAFCSGIPSMVIPYSGDQYFWGKQISKLKVGYKLIKRKDLSSDVLCKAIQFMTSSKHVKENAKILGKKIRKEDGVKKAVGVINNILNRV